MITARYTKDGRSVELEFPEDADLGDVLEAIRAKMWPGIAKADLVGPPPIEEVKDDGKAQPSGESGRGVAPSRQALRLGGKGNSRRVQKGSSGDGLF